MPAPSSRLRQTVRAVTVPLRWTKELAARVVKEGSRATASPLELERVVTEVAQYISEADMEGSALPKFWWAIPRHDLQALYAVALRRSCASLEPGVGDGQRSAFGSLRSKLTDELYRTVCNGKDDNHDGTRAPGPRSLSLDELRLLVLGILRAQALRCFAALLSDMSSQLNAKRLRPPAKTLQAADRLLGEPLQLLLAIPEPSRNLGEGSSSLPTGSEALVEELKKELAASQLLEHWSRLLLHLSACEGGVNDAAMRLLQLTDTLRKLNMRMYTSRDASWHHVVLADAPCFSYLLSSHVVGLCAWLDGGPTYGMPPAVDDDEDEERRERGGRVAAGDTAAAGGRSFVTPVFCEEGRPLLRGMPAVPSIALATWALFIWKEVMETERKENAVASASAPVDLEAAPTMGPSAAGPSATSVASTLQPEAAPPPPPPPQAPRPACARMARLGAGRRALSGTPPLNTAATLEICLRLAAAATAAFPDAAGQAGAASPQPPDRKPAAGVAPAGAVERPARRDAMETDWSLYAGDVSWFAFRRDALECGRTALGEELMAAERVTPATQTRLRQWFSALVGYMGMAAALVSTGSQRRRRWITLMLCPPGKLLAVVGPKGLQDGLPPAPTPCVAAALDAGYVAALDNLLQSMKDRDPSPWPTLLFKNVSGSRLPAGAKPPGNKGCGDAWPQLLAFGDPRETAQLVCTLATLLRTDAAGVGRRPPDLGEALAAVQAVTQGALQLLVSAMRAGEMRGEQGLGHQPQGEQQPAAHPQQQQEQEQEQPSGQQEAEQQQPQRQRQEEQRRPERQEEGIETKEVDRAPEDDGAGAYRNSRAGAAEGATGSAPSSGDQHGGVGAPGPSSSGAPAVNPGGASAAGAFPAPGLPRLALLASHMAVTLLLPARHTLLKGYLRRCQDLQSCLPFLRQQVCNLLAWAELVAVACISDTTSSAAVPPPPPSSGSARPLSARSRSRGSPPPGVQGAPGGSSLSPPSVPAAHRGAPEPEMGQGPGPSSAEPNTPTVSSRVRWRAVLLEDLCLAEVLGAALGLLAREDASASTDSTPAAAAAAAASALPQSSVREPALSSASGPTINLAPGDSRPLRYAAATLLRLLMRYGPRELAEALRSDRAEWAAAAVAGQSPGRTVRGAAAAAAVVTGSASPAGSATGGSARVGSAAGATGSHGAPQASAATPGGGGATAATPAAEVRRPPSVVMQGLVVLVRCPDALQRLRHLCDPTTDLGSLQSVLESSFMLPGDGIVPTLTWPSQLAGLSGGR